MSTLNQFLSDLWKNGQVQVAHELKAFSAEELNEAQFILQRGYAEEQIHFPGTAPNFAVEPALWAAQYLYRAIQFILLRHLDEKAIPEHLLPWPVPINAEAVYAADLSLRHLPGLFSFAKGLSPADPLLLELKKTASIWPFSGLGIAEADPTAETLLLSHPDLVHRLHRPHHRQTPQSQSPTNPYPPLDRRRPRRSRPHPLAQLGRLSSSSLRCPWLS